MAEACFHESKDTTDLGVEADADSPAEMFKCTGQALFSFVENVVKVQTREEEF